MAGNRAGLAGERSGLFGEFIRIADSQPAAWVLWENVIGVLSQGRGEDFATILEAFTGFRPEVPEGGWRSWGFCRGEKRAVTWAVLDSQYRAVAQRRRRVFIVGCPGDGANLIPIFSLGSCLRGDPPPRRKAGKVAPTISSSGAGTPRPAGTASEPDFLVAATLNSGGNNGGFRTEPGEHIVSHALSVPTSNARYDPNGETYVVAETLTAGTAASDGVNHPGRRREDDANLVVSHTLKAEGADASGDGTGRGVPLATDTVRSHPRPGSNSSGNLTWAMNQRDELREMEVPGALSSAPGGRPGHSYPVVGVRRLTPVECERLMGLPDGWTAMLSDSARYRVIGNGVVVPVVRWILKRIKKAMTCCGS